VSIDDEVKKDQEFNEFMEFYREYDTLELIRAMAKIREQKDAIESEAKAVAREYEFLTKVKIPEAFDNDGIKNMSVDGIGRISLRTDIYASIKAGHKEEALQWLSDIGSEDLIQPTVNSSTLKAFLKGRIKSGEDTPEEFFNITPYQQATITKT
jgi:hypothetical protein